MILRVFDISNIVRRGMSRHDILDGGVGFSPATGYYAVSTPSGGIAYLFDIISKYKDDKLIFCCDRRPTVKERIRSTYKQKSRDRRSEEVEKQKRITEEILKDCNFPVLAYDGYEADDIIYTLCKKCYDDYESIVIHSIDSDMCIMVNKKVSIGKVGDAGRVINYANFEFEANKNKVTEYNTIAIGKILHGDSSDCIKALPAGVKKKVSELMDLVDKKDLVNKSLVLGLIEDMVPEALDQAKLIFPLDVDITDDIDIAPNYDRVNKWGYIVGGSTYKAITEIPNDYKEMVVRFCKDE